MPEVCVEAETQREEHALTLYSCWMASGSMVFRADSRDASSSIRAPVANEQELQIQTVT